ALKDKNTNLREAAAGTLVKIGTPAVKPLIAALKYKNQNVRAAAAEALGEIGDPRAVEPLTRLLSDIFHTDHERLTLLSSRRMSDRRHLFEYARITTSIYPVRKAAATALLRLTNDPAVREKVGRAQEVTTHTGPSWTEEEVLCYCDAH
ncbi:MAG: HEAT repeat domain-containing protein, partial [Aigarchaeota archaeon]|nr:HEAT repeat domain-containing protein [Aigarchaeota archaeon]